VGSSRRRALPEETLRCNVNSDSWEADDRFCLPTPGAEGCSAPAFLSPATSGHGGAKARDAKINHE
jgi:hypothetical protein